MAQLQCLVSSRSSRGEKERERERETEKEREREREPSDTTKWNAAVRLSRFVLVHVGLLGILTGAIRTTSKHIRGTQSQPCLSCFSSECGQQSFFNSSSTSTSVQQIRHRVVCDHCMTPLRWTMATCLGIAAPHGCVAARHRNSSDLAGRSA